MEDINNWFKTYEIIIQTFATLSIGIAAILVTWIYAKNSDRISKDQIFNTLYSTFNARYDQINNTLHEMELSDQLTLQALIEHPEFYKASIDFFNICAEEYYWKNKGRIDDDVWLAWHFGMNYWYKTIPALRELWNVETEGQKYKSYYLAKGDKLFDKL